MLYPVVDVGMLLAGNPGHQIPTRVLLATAGGSGSASNFGQSR